MEKYAVSPEIEKILKGTSNGLRNFSSINQPTSFIRFVRSCFFMAKKQQESPSAAHSNEPKKAKAEKERRTSNKTLKSIEKEIRNLKVSIRRFEQLLLVSAKKCSYFRTRKASEVDSAQKDRKFYIDTLQAKQIDLKAQQGELWRAQVEIAATQKILHWIDIPPADFIIENEKMFFVDRDDAVKKLCEHHSGASIRRTQSGLEDRIAILDESFGMGKRAFADNYISR